MEEAEPQTIRLPKISKMINIRFSLFLEAVTSHVHIYIYIECIYLYSYAYIDMPYQTRFLVAAIFREKTIVVGVWNNAKVNTPSLRELPSYGDRLRKVDANSAAFWRKGLVRRCVVFHGVWYGLVGWLVSNVCLKDLGNQNLYQPIGTKQL